MLWQHIPLDRGARALKAGGPNRWNTVQVELIGFARESHTWPAARYARIAALARWIEANFGVPRRAGVRFLGDGATPHLASPAEFRRYEGHIGHQHVPGNDHWDPGALRVELVLEDEGGAPIVRDLARGDSGDDVRALQRLLVRRGYRLLEPHLDGVFGVATEAFVVHFQWRHGLAVDAVVGARTRAALGLAARPGRRAGEPARLSELDGLELGLGDPLADHVDIEPA